MDKLGRSDLKQEWTKHYQEDEARKITEAEQVRVLEELGFHNISIQHRIEMEAIVTAIR